MMIISETEKLFQAKQDLAKFLEEHPELRDFQAKIDASLKKCGNSHNRIAVLSQMMREKLIELGDACRGVVKAAGGVISDRHRDNQ
jgi:uncharacterized coiled-coil DUF342 family protein